MSTHHVFVVMVSLMSSSCHDVNIYQKSFHIYCLNVSLLLPGMSLQYCQYLCEVGVVDFILVGSDDVFQQGKVKLAELKSCMNQSVVKYSYLYLIFCDENLVCEFFFFNCYYDQNNQTEDSHRSDCLA